MTKKKESNIVVKDQYAYFLTAFTLTVEIDGQVGFAPIEIVTKLDDFKFTQQRLLKLREAAMAKYLKELDSEDVEKNKIIHCQINNIVMLGIMTEEEFNGKIDM